MTTKKEQVCGLCGKTGHCMARSKKCGKHEDWLAEKEAKEKKKASRQTTQPAESQPTVNKEWDESVKEKDTEGWFEAQDLNEVYVPNDFLEGPQGIPETHQGSPFRIFSLNRKEGLLVWQTIMNLKLRSESALANAKLP